MTDSGGGLDMLDPKFAPGAEQARQNVMIGVSGGMTAIGVTCVGLRVYTRIHLTMNMGTEDWTMVAVAILTLVMLLELIAGSIEYKIGFSGMTITRAEMEGNLKMILAIIVVYKMIMTLIKVSILLMYLRLSVTRMIEMLCKGTICLLMMYQVIVIIVVPAQCIPLSKLWDFTNQVEGRCIDANAFYHATSAFHILIDLWILFLPMRLILSIQRPPREKVALFVVFGLGVLSMIASVARLQSLRIFTLSDDPFYDSLPINTWSMVEVNIGILCASLPTLKPLLSKAQRHRTREAHNKNEDKSPTTGKSKKGLLTTGKDLFISIQMATLRTGNKDDNFDEEYDPDTKPPPVPPKDDDYQCRPSTSTAESRYLTLPQTTYGMV